MARQPLAVDATSEILLLVLGELMRWFPELQLNPSVAWRMQDALTAATFSEWARFTKPDSQDTFCSASRSSQKAGARNAEYARVSLPPARNQSSLIVVQYEAFDVPSFQPGGQFNPPKSYYGHLKHIISVTFPEGYEDLHLYKGTTLAFALFHQCILVQKDSRLDRLNIRFYSDKDTNLQITDISRVRGLVGRIRDGANSWAIVDRCGGFSREAYLTHETN